jgi:hypothetical protein
VRNKRCEFRRTPFMELGTTNLSYTLREAGSLLMRNSCCTLAFSLGAPLRRRNKGENDVDGESD